MSITIGFHNTNGPIVQSKPPVLTRQNLDVRAEGELIVITIGNSDLRLHYEDALQVSQWIRLRAKEAKRNAGDESRHWSLIGNLSFLEQ